MSIAQERIERLFQLAEKRASEDRKDLAERYVQIARDISTSTQENIPGELKRKFCSECGSFLVPGENLEVRLNSEGNNITYTCSECGEKERYEIEKE